MEYIIGIILVLFFIKMITPATKCKNCGSTKEISTYELTTGDEEHLVTKCLNCNTEK